MFVMVDIRTLLMDEFVVTDLWEVQMMMAVVDDWSMVLVVVVVLLWL